VYNTCIELLHAFNPNIYGIRVYRNITQCYHCRPFISLLVIDNSVVLSTSQQQWRWSRGSRGQLMWEVGAKAVSLTPNNPWQEHIFLSITNQNAGFWPQIFTHKCDNVRGCYQRSSAVREAIPSHTSCVTPSEPMLSDSPPQDDSESPQHVLILDRRPVPEPRE